MKRRIIKINAEKCTGCGLCAQACHEGAIEIIDGKAKLTREDYCDGLGDCLPECPTGAITFENREAPAYNEQAVLASKQKKLKEQATEGLHTACPGMKMHQIAHSDSIGNKPTSVIKAQLGQWPCQIKLVSVNAPYFNEANLLIAADCTAYAYANIHNDFMKNKITLIGCPKLDGVDYTEKLEEIIRINNIKSVTVLRMEVPCCGKLEMQAKTALQNSGKAIALQVVTISIGGEILN